MLNTRRKSRGGGGERIGLGGTKGGIRRGNEEEEEEEEAEVEEE